MYKKCCIKEGEYAVFLNKTIIIIKHPSTLEF